MGKFMTNGYDVINNISRCYSDYEEEILQMEKELRELEAVNDSLEEENEHLKAELQKAAEFKADESLAEIKRSIIEELEKMPADEMKDFIVRTVSSALTGNQDRPKKYNPDHCNLLKAFRTIVFPNADEANDFVGDIKDLIEEYKAVSVHDMWFLLSENYPKAELEDGTKPGSYTLDYTWDMYGIGDKNSIVHSTDGKVVRLYNIDRVRRRYTK